MAASRDRGVASAGSHRPHAESERTPSAVAAIRRTVRRLAALTAGVCSLMLLTPALASALPQLSTGVTINDPIIVQGIYFSGACFPECEAPETLSVAVERGGAIVASGTRISGSSGAVPVGPVSEYRSTVDPAM